MRTVHISLNSIDKVKSFVNDLAKFDADFDLVSGRYITVSYTHLDVYKRQIQHFYGSGKHSGKFLWIVQIRVGISRNANAAAV